MESECPICGSAVVLKSQNRTGRMFFGCVRFPECEGVQPIPRNKEEEVLRAFVQESGGSATAIQDEGRERVRTQASLGHPEGRPAPGEFVVIPAGEALSLATVVSLTEADIVVEQMHAHGEVVSVTCPQGDVAPNEPDLPCPAFYRAPEEETWTLGSITHSHVDDAGVVRWNFQGTGVNALAEGIEIRFRAHGVSVNPLGSLKHWGLDKPRTYQLRERFHKEYQTQNRLVRGMTALLSSSIDHYGHQIEVVERILTDPIPRFILADEVGLGKTIEAGIVLAQRELDGARDQTLILVPDHLERQWSEELSARFSIECGSPRNSLISFSAFLADPMAWASQVWTDVVVDEAHHAAGWGVPGYDEDTDAYEGLKQIAEQADCLLLLSATPQETAKDRLLALLELLDPDLFDRTQLQEFSERLEQRGLVTNLLCMVQDGASPYLYYNALRETLSFVGEATPLRQLVEGLVAQIESEEDPDAQVLNELRVSFREQYRIHNRLIRSSRNRNRLEVWRTPLDGEPDVQELMSPHVAIVGELSDLESALDSWRLHCLQRGLDSRQHVALYAAAHVALAAGESALRCWVELRRGGEPQEEWTCLVGSDVIEASAEIDPIPGEEGILDEIDRLCMGEGVQSAKLEAAASVLRQSLSDRPEDSVVIMASSPGVAGLLSEFLEDRLSDITCEVTELGPEASPNAVQFVCERLMDGDGPPLVVCASSRVEEGGNLQGANRLVHYDVPRIPARLEQRIGRLDRIGQTRQLWQTILVPDPETSVASRYLQVVSSVFGTFQKSVSGLQAVETDILHEIERHFLEEGIHGIEALVPNLQEQLEEEGARLEQDRGMDAAAFGADSTGIDTDQLIQHDRDFVGIRSAWNPGIKAFLGVWNDHDGAYKVPPHGFSTPLSDSDQRDLSCFLSVGNGPPVQGTYSRSKASRDPHTYLRRVGDGLVDWTYDYLRRVERGRVYGVRRFVPMRVWNSLPPAIREPGFHAQLIFDLSVCAGQIPEGQGHDCLAQQNAQRRAEFFFPAEDCTVWVHSGDEPKTTWLHEHAGLSELSSLQYPLKALTEWTYLGCQPYKNARLVLDRANGAAMELPLLDQGLHGGRHLELSRYFSLPAWASRVDAAHREGIGAIEGHPSHRSRIESAVSNFLTASRDREDVLRIRASKDVGSELAAREVIVAAIQDAQIELRAVGLVLLCPSDDQ